MHLQKLPDELIQKILQCLIYDPGSFLNFTLTNKRINKIASTVINSDHWIDRRPFTFKFENQLDQRLFRAKHRKFSAIKFDNSRIGHFSPELYLKFKEVEGIVELIVYNCFIHIEWLDSMLSNLQRLQYLTINDVTFDETKYCMPKGVHTSKNKILKKLTLINDRSVGIPDNYFIYFLQYPAVILDLTNRKVEYNKRIIQRFYPQVDDIHSNPSKFILSFLMILHYLKLHKSVVKTFIGTGTGMNAVSLQELLLDNQLNHLDIFVKNCPELNRSAIVRNPERNISRQGRLVM